MPRTSVAVILVAGVGSRLRPLTDDRPKALVSLGSETILGRALRILSDYGVIRVVLATGYREDAVRSAVAASRITWECVRNPDYATTQNSVSLALCAGAVGSGAFFKLDGDVIFEPEVLARLDACDAELAVAVDRSRAVDAEAMKVRLGGPSGEISAFGKHIPLVESAGESIGIERLSSAAAAALFPALRANTERGRTNLYYEDVYSELIAAGRLRATCVDVSDLPWTEVDDPSDLERARNMVTHA